MTVFPRPVLDALRARPDLPLFDHGGHILSRGDFLDLIARMAGGLRAAGIDRRHGVAFVLRTTPEAYAALFAAHCVGCRVVVVYPGYTDAQIEHVLRSGVDMVITDVNLPALLGKPDLRTDGRPEDVARVLYTTGSTGLPKGCAQTYRALTEHFLWQPDAWSPLIHDLAAGSRRYLCHGPLASSVALDWVALALYGGGLAIIPSEDPDDLFPAAIPKYGITGACVGVPRFHRMLQAPPVDTSSLEWLMVAGGPVTPARLAEAAELLGPVVHLGYGTTETNAISVLTPHDEPGSAGRPLPQVEIEISGGEIHVRSPYVMSHYWDDPEQTASVLADGWYRTGDLGHLDETGHLHVTGRSKDVIVVDTWNCYVTAIESVLLSDPDVDQAFVVGLPDERSGEAVHAFLVPRRGRQPDPLALTSLVSEELGGPHAPKTITLIDHVPVGPSGKPDKQALARLLTETKPC